MFAVPVKVVFRCQFCAAQPDAATHLSLRASIRQHVFGQYLDALPGRWLVWHGNGILGPTRYACEEHRGDLVAFLREHYGTVAPHPWARPPYPTSVRTESSDRAMTIKLRQGNSGFF